MVPVGTTAEVSRSIASNEVAEWPSLSAIWDMLYILLPYHGAGHSKMKNAQSKRRFYSVHDYPRPRPACTGNNYLCCPNSMAKACLGRKASQRQ